MLIGYVSDERYVALHDVALEFERGDEFVRVARSTARGAVYAEVEPGAYRVTVARDGYGAKTVSVDVPSDLPYAFRLLSDGLLGYMWPRWVRAGEQSEYRIHAAEECQVSMWRYGLRKERVRLLNWHGEHGPRAGVQKTPDGDYT